MLEWHNDVVQCSSSQRTFCSFLQTLSFNMLCITRPAVTGTKSTAAIPKLIECSPVQEEKGQCLMQHYIESYADIDFPTNQLAISSPQIYCFSLNIVLNSTIPHTRSSVQPCRYVFIGNRCCKWSSYCSGTAWGTLNSLELIKLSNELIFRTYFSSLWCPILCCLIESATAAAVRWLFPNSTCPPPPTTTSAGSRPRPQPCLCPSPISLPRTIHPYGARRIAIRPCSQPQPHCHHHRPYQPTV